MAAAGRKVFGLSVVSVLLPARRRILALGALLLLALSTTGQVPASKKGRPLTREEVAVVWVGLSQDELYLLRVELDSNGQGIGADSLRGEAPRVFRASWDYHPPEITIQTESAGNEGLYALGTLRGEITGVAMHLVAVGDGWRTEYELRREAELERRWSDLKTAMSERLAKDRSP